MNRWTGTGHLTKDPKLLETDNGTAICILRVAVSGGRQGQDGYFDARCFDGQAHACVEYLKAGREVAIDGRLLFDVFRTQDGGYASRVYVIAERVELPAIAPPVRPPRRRRPSRSPLPPARHATPTPPDIHRGPATDPVTGPQTSTSDRYARHRPHEPNVDKRPPRRCRALPNRAGRRPAFR